MAERELKLRKFFNTTLAGQKPLAPSQKDLFIEAFCSQADVIGCLNHVRNSQQGLQVIQNVMRFDLSETFFNSGTVKVLTYLQGPDVANIDSGKFVFQYLHAIVEPPIFWTPFCEAFKAQRLGGEAQKCFAWVLLQLIMLSDNDSAGYRALAQDPQIIDILLNSPDLELRTYGQKLKNAVATADVKGDYRPGGRHDNDFEDYREISILPTGDEVMSSEFPFLRRRVDVDDPETLGSRAATYLDNQFRLLREDMLSEMREEIQIAGGKNKGKRRGFSAEGLQLIDVHCTPDVHHDRWGILLRLSDEFPQFRKLNSKQRVDYLKRQSKFLAHQSLTCLFGDGHIIGFASIQRDEGLLSGSPPVLLLLPYGSKTTIENLLTKLQSSNVLSIMQINTAIFAYEPVLKAIQSMKAVPLEKEILFWHNGYTPISLQSMARSIVSSIQASPQSDLQKVLCTPKSIKLDKSQSQSLLAGLSQRLTLIQGPPGTGKSFIGALLAKVIHDHTSQSILVVCYTNHALDQFLEDLLDIGIPIESMVRLGGKFTSRTEKTLLRRQTLDHRFGRTAYTSIGELKQRLQDTATDLQRAFDKYKVAKIRPGDILAYLEFEEPDFFEAFSVPQSTNGEVLVGKKGRKLFPTYLIEQWMRGQDAGVLKDHTHIKSSEAIWTTPKVARHQRLSEWQAAIVQERVSEVVRYAKLYNDTQDQLDATFAQKDIAILKSKRIVGCTTTAAAKYTQVLQSAAPEVLLVEEAGEILESHVLTALGGRKEQLILIGDHKQLRPKVNNYTLTVEKGEGYDLNVSLFERLVIKGYPHETLNAQHRMRPEISRLVRELTYPGLVDAPSTQGRPDTRGLRDNVIFIDHSHPEDNNPEIVDRFATSSKQNSYEVAIVIKIIRYLAQQGYGTDSMVVLTPYLGQLNNLFNELKRDTDPILNDLDSFDLVRAGLVTQASAKLTKKPIRLATIDNYQGEESDIVIISLTRSNPNNDIGFMFSPERLNVLLSRARNGLIIVGNATTYTHSKKGGELWSKLIDLLRSGGHLYEGLPVKCERHPSRITTLVNTDDFDTLCPDGGCAEPCGSKLSCGLHTCPSKCHQLVDHSKMECLQIMTTQCPNGKHTVRYKCHQGPPPNCRKCEQDVKRREQKAQQDFDLKQKQEAEQLAHVKKMAEIEAEIERERQKLRDAQLAREREDAIRQRKEELAETIRMTIAGNIQKSTSDDGDGIEDKGRHSPPIIIPTRPPLPAPSIPPPPTTTTPTPTPTPTLPLKATSTPNEGGKAQDSGPETEWKRQKSLEGAANDAIDTLMEMTGLEEVKSQLLRIKDKVDLARRQNTSLKNERFHAVLQGNPGTGKTTVARIYAKFLTSVDALPGNRFIETTGARLSNDGVPEAKKLLEGLINDGGGALFIDEAYQLTSGHNFQGRQVLDFLLAEMENSVGKIVFLFAGYRKEMEKFFEHNPGLPSRVPYSMLFEDYTDAELLGMLEKMIKKHWEGRMKVEDGTRGLFCRIAVRRLGCGRGKEGFGNARALANMFARMRERQAARVQKARRTGQPNSDFELLGVDIIGPDPAAVLRESTAYTKLKQLTGLNSVKQSVDSLFSLIATNYERELHEKKPVEVSLNRVFIGSPGTGKTTVAKLYGEILANMGVLSNGEVVVKNPADFVGSALGQSEANTKAILASTVGKVLVIDEAYMLYSKQGGTADPYKTAVIDTIVAEVQSVPGEDRCVLLLGYKEQMEEMFQNVNPGLARRFAIENAFKFEDFTDPELLEIMNLKLKQQDLAATDDAKKVAIAVLARARNRPNFGNGGEVENLLSQAKARYQARASKSAVDIVFEPQDFDPDHDRNSRAATNLQELFKDIIGCENVITRLGDYQRIAETIKSKNLDARTLIPTSFVFKGPPGTGKTTVARKMGQVYYDMGFLSSTEVVECSASDLVGEYVGQTGPKTKKLFEKALGRVLFIDEAYRLGEGHFAQEAMDELVGILTQERYMGKIVVILAGYDAEMDRLLGVNPGLASRFPESIIFEDVKPAHALKLLAADLTKNGIRLAEIEDTSSDGYDSLTELIEDLSILPSWGNARDIKTLAKKMIQWTFANQDSSASSSSTAETILPLDTAVSIIRQMLDERQRQEDNKNSRSNVNPLLPMQTMNAGPPQRHTTKTAQNTKTKAPRPPKKTGPAPPAETSSSERDPDVSDDVWAQLERAKAEQLRVEKEAQAAIQKAERARAEAKAREEKLKREIQAMEQAERKAQEDAAKRELQKKLEEERLKAQQAREERVRLEKILQAKREQERKRKQEEQKAQEKLREMGICPMGYRWIRCGDGWRCSAGGHYVSRAELGM
ncbi:CbxX/CfxQ family protein [Pleurotus pulmonarius]